MGTRTIRFVMERHGTSESWKAGSHGEERLTPKYDGCPHWEIAVHRAVAQGHVVQEFECTTCGESVAVAYEISGGSDDERS